ncbi:unnamed protein product [Acanthoscelides obtectus]|uniref:Uncharacterized protein n=1 Tax=Acanthoscelides obtectus TaxID=200917 RepID=A0A9P0L643_ACAOB|nr:unnamed protein product [Acanthoscelides obtectus]CAK1666324.1 hypothetical protein AOBTE_LOCUS25256 [Acanthoscelides obtectus]
MTPSTYALHDNHNVINTECFIRGFHLSGVVTAPRSSSTATLPCGAPEPPQKFKVSVSFDSLFNVESAPDWNICVTYGYNEFFSSFSVGGSFTEKDYN